MRQLLRGGCHCGAVRFTASVDDGPVQVLDCNCSICAKSGFLHIIVPHDDLALEGGRDELSTYRFGSGAAEHLFCRRCGVKSFYQPRSHPGSWSVNARCLDERPAMEVTKFDGRDWEQAKAALDGAPNAG